MKFLTEDQHPQGPVIFTEEGGKITSKKDFLKCFSRRKAINPMRSFFITQEIVNTKIFPCLPNDTTFGDICGYFSLVDYVPNKLLENFRSGTF